MQKAPMLVFTLKMKNFLEINTFDPHVMTYHINIFCILDKYSFVIEIVDSYSNKLIMFMIFRVLRISIMVIMGYVYTSVHVRLVTCILK